MLMKWEDLEPGDVVEFNPSFIIELSGLRFDERSASHNNIYKTEINDLLNIINQQKEFIIYLVVINQRIELNLKDINWCFYLDENGFSCSIPRNMNSRIFNVVKLKED